MNLLMKIFQTLAVLLLSLLLLVTLWPLFILLVIIIIIYWIIIKKRILQAVDDVKQMNDPKQSSSDPKVIDVEIIEERKES